MEFPLGEFVAVTGVSGSGKSTLVNSILKRALAQKINRNSAKPGKFKSISGYESIEKSLISIKVRLGAHHEAILRHILVYLMISEIYLHKQMKLKCVGIKRSF